MRLVSLSALISPNNKNYNISHEYLRQSFLWRIQSQEFVEWNNSPFFSVYIFFWIKFLYHFISLPFNLLVFISIQCYANCRVSMLLLLLIRHIWLHHQYMLKYTLLPLTDMFYNSLCSYGPLWSWCHGS